jgi:hypothetical protein
MFAFIYKMLFEEALEFKQTILLLWEAKDLTLHQRVPKAQGWVTIEVVPKCLNLMVITCVMNQSRTSLIIIKCFGYCSKPNCDYGS